MIFDSIQFPNIDPSALTLPGFALGSMFLGPFHLRWYALAYIAGLVLGWRWMVYLIRKDRLWKPNKPPLTPLLADDFLFWATLGVILGGRIGYVLFYMLPSEVERAKIGADIFTVFRIWEGGMSFHGGFLGVALAAIWFTRRLHIDEAQFTTLAKKRAVADLPEAKRRDFTQLPNIGWVKKTDVADLQTKTRTYKVDLLKLGDIVAAAAPIGLFFGRLANFINGELWGRKADVPWAMVFCNPRLMDSAGNCPAGLDPRHPSQLYEATLEGLVLFAIINVLTLKYDSLRRPGLNSGIFLVCYGLFRALLESVREPDAQMPEALRGFLTMGMLLSIPMIIVGAWLIRRALNAPAIAKPA